MVNLVYHKYEKYIENVLYAQNVRVNQSNFLSVNILVIVNSVMSLS